METIPICKPRDDGADMRLTNSSATRNPKQGLYCFITFVMEVVEKKQVFSQSFNIPRCIVVGLSMVEGLLKFTSATKLFFVVK